VKVNGGTGNTVDVEELVKIELSRSLGFLTVSMNDRSAGNIAAANREELSAHRAYQEALHLYRVLRSHLCQAGARRLALRIKKIDNAMHGA
jgi:hypothetical protein